MSKVEDFIRPMLASSVDRLPAGDEWAYELKLDGYRAIAARAHGRVSLYSRRGNSYNADFPEIIQGLKSLPDGTVIDGEVVALDEAVLPSFNLLQNHRSHSETVFYAFDLLRDGGTKTIHRSLNYRRELLVPAVNRLGERIRFSETFEDRDALLKVVRKLKLEGIVAKKRDSIYEPGKRSDAWLKYKAHLSQEFVIGGCTRGNPFDALVVGQYEAGKLMFVAKVRAGFVPWSRAHVSKHFKGLEISRCPFSNLPEKKGRPYALTAEDMKSCTWLKPKLVAQIEFVSWTADKKLRHSKFAGLREDKKARDVKAECREASPWQSGVH